MQPPDTTLRAPVQAQAEATWVQPYEPRLEPVEVNTEVRVVSPVPPPCSSCQAPVSPAVDIFVPALFNAILQLGAAPAQAPVHGAEPVSPSPR